MCQDIYYFLDPILTLSTRLPPIRVIEQQSLQSFLEHRLKCRVFSSAPSGTSRHLDRVLAALVHSRAKLSARRGVGGLRFVALVRTPQASTLGMSQKAHAWRRRRSRC